MIAGLQFATAGGLVTVQRVRMQSMWWSIASKIIPEHFGQPAAGLLVKTWPLSRNWPSRMESGLVVLMSARHLPQNFAGLLITFFPSPTSVGVIGSLAAWIGRRTAALNCSRSSDHPHRRGTSTVGQFIETLHYAPRLPCLLPKPDGVCSSKAGLIHMTPWKTPPTTTVIATRV